MKNFFVFALSRDEEYIIGPFNSYVDAEVAGDKWFDTIPEEEWRDSSFDVWEEAQ